ncbi:ATP-binding cassette domain-containing protein [Enterocloster citroniae]|jgi:ATP-binding cassette subfamily B protein IrtB|uniref:ATP-binding cassette domain-containing protein n=1 Tax=Enterocloster citroniae TaxID=358743 RepID=A0AA41FHG9_9FIRM|nr:ABC transporter ATP-binding protein [Enterocloster citroniae]MBT9811343.1 ATP-binding cassette domain-containing protein [Enterocloster citroniae]RGC12104.1 ABC transporter ATP-binding protein [Enterocloster citroniae]
MRELFKKHFALTDKGAKDLQRASAASFFVYVINFFPAMLLLLLVDELLLNNVKETELYLWGAILVLAAMWILLRIEYDALYNTTYQESENLRTEIADILTKLPLSYFSRHDLSDLAQTIMADVAAIEHAMSHAMAKAVGFLFFFPLLSVLLLLGNVKLGLAIILPILLGFGLLLLSKNLQIRESFKHYQKLRDNSESFQEAIENQQEIKSFGLTQKIRQTLYQKMEESEKIHLRAEISAGIPMLCSSVILQFAFVIVILTGVQMLHTGEINILYFLGYVLASIKVRESVESVNMNVEELYYLDSMVKRIREVRETKIQQGKDQTISSYDIEFDQVSFSYDKDTEVLKNVSFTAKQNEVTALVGVSGCGKTSILRLMSRLYDYDGGSIRIGGLDIKELSTKSLFEKLSIVFQDVTLFNTSVLENIRIGKKTATDEEVIRAARLANCEEFIRRLPEGYKTMIGENGATLSGGERQRLSIARAFLKDSPIIILDEIAASLDVENEKKIQDSLNRLILDKTVIIISHRLKSVENADKIVVIDCGRVEASGTHLELLKTSPTYNNLVEKAKLTEEFQY